VGTIANYVHYNPRRGKSYEVLLKAWQATYEHDDLWIGDAVELKPTSYAITIWRMDHGSSHDAAEITSVTISAHTSYMAVPYWHFATNNKKETYGKDIMLSNLKDTNEAIVLIVERIYHFLLGKDAEAKKLSVFFHR
jgi:hypothetical protein